MAITVLFFGQLVEITGFGELQIIVTKPITGSEDLKEVLLSRFPGLADIVFNIAVDSVIIEEDTRLKPGCIVALLPPFSGG